MAKRTRKPASDLNQLGKSIVESATAEEATALPLTPVGKNAAAVALGRLGGIKGGKARAAKLSKKRRSEIAKEAARARWGE